jgi:hypothetical protein
VILLWGLAQDAPLRLVRDALVQKGASFIFLNQADLLDTHVEVEYTPSVTGVLRLGDREYRLEDIRAMYLRPYDFREFPQLSPLDAQSSQWRHALAVEDVLWGFADVAQGVVVNRPSAMRSNSSKPYQCRLIEAHGFKVPETLITTDASAARWFRAQYREVVYKSISAQRSIVNRLSDEHESRMADLRWCPTQFQCWVPGVDHRVHVVGEQVFAVRVLSDDVDYRYGFARMEPCQLPDVCRRALLVDGTRPWSAIGGHRPAPNIRGRVGLLRSKSVAGLLLLRVPRSANKPRSCRSAYGTTERSYL